MDQREIIREKFAARLTRLLAERGETTYSVGRAVALSPGTISRYCNGLIAPKLTTLYAIAQVLKADPVWLMGYDQTPPPLPEADNILPLTRREVPLLGSIAAGEPIFADGQTQSYLETETPAADFALRVKGDSMTGARIYDGDIVFIKAQDDVDDGEIAAVQIDDEATLKRVFKLGDRVILRAENPAYPPFEFAARDGRNIRILGKAVAFQGAVR